MADFVDDRVCLVSLVAASEGCSMVEAARLIDAGAVCVDGVDQCAYRVPIMGPMRVEVDWWAANAWYAPDTILPESRGPVDVKHDAKRRPLWVSMIDPPLWVLVAAVVALWAVAGFVGGVAQGVVGAVVLVYAVFGLRWVS